MTVGDHDPADIPVSEWVALRPVIKSRLADPRVRKRLDAPYAVNRNYDIPYVCGMNVGWDEVFADLHCPINAAPIGDGGAVVDLTPFIWLHECGEMAFIEYYGDIYQQAHKLITIAEHDEVTGAGLNWRRYCRFFDSYDRSTEGETLKVVPKRLFLRPYQDSGDWLLITQMQAVMV